MAGEFETEELVLFKDSTGEIKIVPVSSNPGLSPGHPAPLGSLAISTEGFIYQKVGGLDTDWTPGTRLGAESKFSAFNNTPRGSRTNSFFTYLELPCDITITGDYKLEFSYNWSSDSVNDNIVVEICDDQGNVWDLAVMETADSTGTGIQVQNVANGPATLDSGTDQRVSVTGAVVVPNLPLGLRTFELRMRPNVNNKVMALYRVAMFLEKL